MPSSTAPCDPVILTPKHLQLARAIAASYPPTSLTHCDLRSAAYYGLVRARASFRPNIGAPFPSYARIRIHGTIKDELRRADTLSRQERKRWRLSGNSYPGGLCPLEDAQDVPTPAPTPEQQALVVEQCVALRRAIDTLPPELRRVVELVDLAELPHAEAALRLNLNLRTVNRYHCDALGWLRDQLAYLKGPAIRNLR